MKFLIWLGWLTLAAVINTALAVFGVVLGGLPTFVLYGLVFFGAYKSCKALDARRKAKKEANQEGN